MNLKVIGACKKFLELENSWKDIFNESGTNNIFISWEWCSLWWKYYGGDQKLLVMVVKDGDEIIGIAPLMIDKGNSSTFWKPIVRFIGGDIADYADFLILRDNEEVIRTIINSLIRFADWGVIDLKRIPESSPNLMLIQECIAGLKYPHVSRVSCISPVVRISEVWDDYYKSISKGIRQDIRTAHNKFKLIGDISFDSYNENPSKALLDIFFEMHKKRQVYKVGQSLYDSEKNRNFFYDLAFTFTRLGWVDISVLKIKNQIISMAFSFMYEGIFYYWIPVFDPDFIRYSPGKVHFYALLKRCFKKNYKQFDFMRGDEEYKVKWANNVLHSYEVKIYKGNLCYGLDALRYVSKNHSKKLYNKHPLFKKILVKITKSNLLKYRE